MSPKHKNPFALHILPKNDGRMARVKLVDGTKVVVMVPDDHAPFTSVQDVLIALMRVHRMTLDEHTWIAPGVYSALELMRQWGQRVEAWHEQVLASKNDRFPHLFMTMIQPFHVGTDKNTVVYQTPTLNEMDIILEAVRSNIRTRHTPMETTGPAKKKAPGRPTDVMGLGPNNIIMVCGTLSGPNFESTLDQALDDECVKKISARLIESLTRATAEEGFSTVAASGFISVVDLINIRTQRGVRKGDLHSTQMKRLAAEAVELAQDRLIEFVGNLKSVGKSGGK